ncbi:hypothetical protein MKK84_14655 [Methylobacterium sp. E-065]|uniref:hypothetical protein n=1 Tax=Methylobacterium sp. E-065 TaxID=2836583 RepID=UPI001FBA5C9C|nr:hypothetical protein [Methylobacterium sp. E-065]MCJ2018663.1 hypothetical protein [Methylobacterium sp. E-065]
MHAQRHDSLVEIRPSEAEGIAAAYLRAAAGDARAALVQAIMDALTDLDAAEQRLVKQRRLISRGYAYCLTGAA